MSGVEYSKIDFLEMIDQVITRSLEEIVPEMMIAIMDLLKLINEDGGTIVRENLLVEELEDIDRKRKVLGDWVDVRLENKFNAFAELKSILFCPFEDVPLHINDPLMRIAAWRLEHNI